MMIGKSSSHGQKMKIKFRCPVCGDGRPQSAHAVTDDMITAHCFRCGSNFLIAEYPDVYAKLLSDASIGPRMGQNSEDYKFSAQNLREFWDSLEVIQRTEKTRFSALQKRRFGEYEVFPMYDSNLHFCGIHFRGIAKRDGVLQKVSKSFGSRGLGFVDPDVPYRSSFLRLVEGPYDALSDQDVVLYGLPWGTAARYPFPQHIILCPDGDFSENKIVQTAWVHFGNMLSRKGYRVEIELLPLGFDPDEVPPETRMRVPWREFAESQIFATDSHSLITYGG